MEDKKGDGIARRQTLDEMHASSHAMEKEQQPRSACRRHSTSTFLEVKNSGSNNAVPFQTSPNSSMTPNGTNYQKQMHSPPKNAAHDQGDTSSYTRSNRRSMRFPSAAPNGINKEKTTSSFFGNAHSKLSGYLSTSKHKNQSSRLGSGNPELDPQTIPPMDSESGRYGTQNSSEGSNSTDGPTSSLFTSRASLQGKFSKHKNQASRVGSGNPELDPQNIPPMDSESGRYEKQNSSEGSNSSGGLTSSPFTCRSSLQGKFSSNQSQASDLCDDSASQARSIKNEYFDAASISSTTSKKSAKKAGLSDSEKGFEIQEYRPNRKEKTSESVNSDDDLTPSSTSKSSLQGKLFSNQSNTSKKFARTKSVKKAGLSDSGKGFEIEQYGKQNSSDGSNSSDDLTSSPLSSMSSLQGKLSSNQSHPSDVFDDSFSQAQSIKTECFDSESVSSKTSKKSASTTKSAKKSVAFSDSEKGFELQVFDLPWRDQRPNSNFQGRYSGPVDESLQPHGKGTVVLQGNELLPFVGAFDHGWLVSPLTCDDRETQPGTTPLARSHNSIKRRSSISTVSSSNSRRIPQDPPGVTIEDPSEHIYVYVPDKVIPNTVEKQKRTNRGPKTSSSVDARSALTRRSAPLLLKNSDGPTSDFRSTSKTTQRYNLGDIARSPREMIIHKSNSKAIHSVSLLKLHEQVFLRRTNGLWTVAILADRSLQPIKSGTSQRWYGSWELDSEGMELEECMLFVINRNGATEIIPRRSWGAFVRCMKLHEIDEAV